MNSPSPLLPFPFTGVEDFVKWYGTLCAKQLAKTEKPVMPTESIMPVVSIRHRKKRSQIADINDLKCTEVDCPNQAIYGLPGFRNTHCPDHRTTDMVNRSRFCRDCPKIAVFGFKNSRAIYCKKHKHENMSNVMNFGCSDPSCEKTASFGFDTPTCCFIHKEPKMKNLNLDFRKCSDEGCPTSASFGFKCEKSTKCSKHKEPLMYHSNYRSKMCKFEDCVKNADSDGYCFEHNDDNFVPSHPVDETFVMNCTSGGKQVDLVFVPMKKTNP